MAHDEWLLGVRQAFSHLSSHIEDCDSWWLFGCHIAIGYYEVTGGGYLLHSQALSLPPLRGESLGTRVGFDTRSVTQIKIHVLSCHSNCAFC